MEKLNIAVLMGGRSSEREVSLASGKNVAQSLDTGQFRAIPVEICLDSKWIAWDSEYQHEQPVELRPGELWAAGQKIDVVFIALHGRFGEDGTVQGLLEMIDVPYTGSGVLASALAMNKILSKKIFSLEKIPTTDFIEVECSSWPDDTRGKIRKTSSMAETLGRPLVIKPACEGSSIGVHIAEKDEHIAARLDEAFSYGNIVLAEKYLKAREIQCGVIGNSNPYALPLIEIVSKKEFFDYEAKYSPELVEEIVPAPISESATERIQQISIKAYQALGCAGFARVDNFVQDDGQIFVSEINTIPGLTQASLFPKEAKAAGIEFPQLLSILIDLALEAK